MASLRRALACLVLFAAVPSGCHRSTFNVNSDIGSLRPVHAMWVTRFDYRTEADILDIVRHCDELGMDTLMFQVRGNATAFYDSAYEPWAEELGGRYPGFDPLEVALRETRKRGMRLNAWVNLMPAWWGTTPPRDPEQLYNAHPEWMWYDQHGARQPLCERFYVSVNPCLPEVRQYLVDVLQDLVTRYNVDGLHLDYVRFPNEPPGTPAAGLDYPRDEETVERFRARTGSTPDEAPAAWDAFRAECVTTLVRDIRVMLRVERPLLELSIAVGPEPDVAREEHFQDVSTWLQQGLVDRVFPMNYTSDPELFLERAAIWEELADARQVVMGIRVDTSPPPQVGSYLRVARQSFHGYCLFAYQSLFDGPNVALVEQSAEARRERQALRAELEPYLRERR